MILLRQGFIGAANNFIGRISCHAKPVIMCRCFRQLSFSFNIYPSMINTDKSIMAHEAILPNLLTLKNDFKASDSI